MQTREYCHNFWKSPPAPNDPATYAAAPPARAAYIKALIERTFPTARTVLEPGCNTGRNLAALCKDYTVRGIEISPAAVKHLRKKYRRLKDVTIVNGTLEEELPYEPTTDVIFTCAVLEHIHPDSKALFKDMADLTKLGIITIEDEVNATSRHCPRNYKNVFVPLGMKEVFMEIPPEPTGLGKHFRTRVFIHA